MLTDGSIDEDRAYDDIPKEWWLENQKTTVLLAMLISPKITSDPITAKPGKARKEIQEVERAIRSDVRRDG
jgi:hypothetical protein